MRTHPTAGALLLVVPLLLTSIARASEADALSISQVIQARHLPYGTILDPVYADPTSNQIVSYTRCGDSAIWTGHYLAAEAFRYNVTGEADALANVKSAIAGIQSLLDVTGTELLARCAFPANSPYAASIIGEEMHNGIYTGATPGEQWVGNTSRDEYSGVFFGLAVAYDMVNDAGVQASASTLVTRMLDFLRGHAWNVVMPDGSISTTFLIRPDEELSFMTVGAHVNAAKYAGAPELTSGVLAAGVSIPIAVDTAGNSSYFKFNLDNINLYNLVRLDSGPYHGLYKLAYGVFWNYVENQQNAFFNMVNRALDGADATRDAATQTMLNQWLERPQRDPYVDLTGVIPACGTGEACNPVPVPQRPTTDFLWQRDPFQLQGGGAGTTEGAGIDYILPYWMARYYGVTTSASVVNAGNPATSSVAPVSIASFYAANLATATASATTLPLPLTLGGIGVSVQDFAGVSRAAGLFYVSPTQINFEIPAGTALGLANIQATSSSGAVLATTTAMVVSVSPGLFAATTGTPGVLVLYGTGIRGVASPSDVAATINGANAAVTYAGPQGQFEGLDQVNVTVPASLYGPGEMMFSNGLAQVLVSAGGLTSNPLDVLFAP